MKTTKTEINQTTNATNEAPKAEEKKAPFFARFLAKQEAARIKTGVRAGSGSVKYPSEAIESC
jgi:hypothetical protein